MGPYTDEERVDEVSDKMVNPQVFRLDTKNTAQATREIKARLANNTNNIDDVVRRFKHKERESGISSGLSDEILRA
jgi:hypothetical protein